MTPENQQIQRILEPVLAEAGLSWTELLLSNTEEERYYWTDLRRIIDQNGRDALDLLMTTGSATLRAGAERKLSCHGPQLDHLDLARRLWKSLRPSP